MRITQYKPLEKSEIEKMRVKAVCKLAIIEEVKKSVFELEERAKKITKREADKITARLKDLCPDYGTIKASFGTARYGNHNELTINLEPTPEIKSKIGSFYSLELFEIDFPVIASYSSPHAVEWIHSSDRDLSVSGLNEFIEAYPKIIKDYNKIQSILDKRDREIEASVKVADSKIPEHIHLAIFSYSN